MILAVLSPKSNSSPKDATNWRESVDSFFVGKTSYMILYGDTCCLIFRRGLELGKVGRGGRVCQGVEKPRPKTFNFVLGTFVAYETSAGLFPTDYLRPEFDKTININDMPLP